jgi:hypothetical protein
MSAPWIETVAGVALGAAIGSVPASLSIRFENRRFEARAKAEYRAEEAARLRGCLVPTMKCLALWAYVADYTFIQTGEDERSKQSRLMGLVNDSNAAFLSAMGEFLTNSRASRFQEKYQSAQSDGNEYIKTQAEGFWAGGPNDDAKRLIASLKVKSKDFSDATKAELELLDAPATLKRTRN